MPGNLQITQATSADIVTLAELFLQQASDQQQLSPYFKVDRDSDWTAIVAGKLNRPDCEVFVCRDQDTIVGYMSVRLVDQFPESKSRGWRQRLRALIRAAGKSKPQVAMFKLRRYGFVEDWYVRPEQRHQGVGRQLWQAAQQWFAARDVREVDTTVWINNEQSMEIFRHLGFQPVRVMMRKQL